MGFEQPVQIVDHGVGGAFRCLFWKMDLDVGLCHSRRSRLALGSPFGQL